MSGRIYPVSGTVNKFPSPGPSPEEMGQSRQPDGEVEEQAAVLEWLPVLSLASFLCSLLQKRPQSLKSDFWEPIAPVTVRRERKVVSLMQGKTGATRLHQLQQQGWCALGNPEPASRKDRRFPMQE